MVPPQRDFSVLLHGKEFHNIQHKGTQNTLTQLGDAKVNRSDKSYRSRGGFPARKALWLLETKVTLSVNSWKRLEKIRLQPNYPCSTERARHVEGTGSRRLPTATPPLGCVAPSSGQPSCSTPSIPNQPWQFGKALALRNGLQD